MSAEHAANTNGANERHVSALTTVYRPNNYLPYHNNRHLLHVWQWTDDGFWPSSGHSLGNV